MVFQNGVEVGRTPVIKKTLDPEWEQKQSRFRVPLPRDPALAQLEVSVYDKDRVGTDDFLGSLRLAGEKVRVPRERRNRKTVYDLRPRPGSSEKEREFVKGRIVVLYEDVVEEEVVRHLSLAV